MDLIVKRRFGEDVKKFKDNYELLITRYTKRALRKYLLQWKKIDQPEWGFESYMPKEGELFYEKHPNEYKVKLEYGKYLFFYNDCYSAFIFKSDKQVLYLHQKHIPAKEDFLKLFDNDELLYNHLLLKTLDIEIIIIKIEDDHLANLYAIHEYTKQTGKSAPIEDDVEDFVQVGNRPAAALEVIADNMFNMPVDVNGVGPQTHFIIKRLGFEDVFIEKNNRGIADFQLHETPAPQILYGGKTFDINFTPRQVFTIARAPLVNFARATVGRGQVRPVGAPTELKFENMCYDDIDIKINDDRVTSYDLRIARNNLKISNLRPISGSRNIPNFAAQYLEFTAPVTYKPPIELVPNRATPHSYDVNAMGPQIIVVPPNTNYMALRFQAFEEKCLKFNRPIARFPMIFALKDFPAKNPEVECTVEIKKLCRRVRAARDIKFITNFKPFIQLPLGRNTGRLAISEYNLQTKVNADANAPLVRLKDLCYEDVLLWKNGSFNSYKIAPSKGKFNIDLTIYGKLVNGVVNYTRNNKYPIKITRKKLKEDLTQKITNVRTSVAVPKGTGVIKLQLDGFDPLFVKIESDILSRFDVDFVGKKVVKKVDRAVFKVDLCKSNFKPLLITFKFTTFEQLKVKPHAPYSVVVKKPIRITVTNQYINLRQKCYEDIYVENKKVTEVSTFIFSDDKILYTLLGEDFAFNLLRTPQDPFGKPTNHIPGSFGKNVEIIKYKTDAVFKGLNLLGKKAIVLERDQHKDIHIPLKDDVIDEIKVTSSAISACSQIVPIKWDKFVDYIFFAKPQAGTNYTPLKLKQVVPVGTYVFTSKCFATFYVHCNNKNAKNIMFKVTLGKKSMRPKIVVKDNSVKVSHKLTLKQVFTISKNVTNYSNITDIPHGGNILLSVKTGIKYVLRLWGYHAVELTPLEDLNINVQNTAKGDLTISGCNVKGVYLVSEKVTLPPYQMIMPDVPDGNSEIFPHDQNIKWRSARFALYKLFHEAVGFKINMTVPQLVPPVFKNDGNILSCYPGHSIALTFNPIKPLIESVKQQTTVNKYSFPSISAININLKLKKGERDVLEITPFYYMPEYIQVNDPFLPSITIKADQVNHATCNLHTIKFAPDIIIKESAQDRKAVRLTSDPAKLSVSKPLFKLYKVGDHKQYFEAKCYSITKKYLASPLPIKFENDVLSYADFSPAFTKKITFTSIPKPILQQVDKLTAQNPTAQKLTKHVTLAYNDGIKLYYSKNNKFLKPIYLQINDPEVRELDIKFKKPEFDMIYYAVSYLGVDFEVKSVMKELTIKRNPFHYLKSAYFNLGKYMYSEKWREILHKIDIPKIIGAEDLKLAAPCSYDFKTGQIKIAGKILSFDLKMKGDIYHNKLKFKSPTYNYIFFLILYKYSGTIGFLDLLDLENRIYFLVHNLDDEMYIYEMSYKIVCGLFDRLTNVPPPINTDEPDMLNIDNIVLTDLSISKMNEKYKTLFGVFNSINLYREPKIDIYKADTMIEGLRLIDQYCIIYNSKQELLKGINSEGIHIWGNNYYMENTYVFTNLGIKEFPGAKKGTLNEYIRYNFNDKNQVYRYTIKKDIFTYNGKVHTKVHTTGKSFAIKYLAVLIDYYKRNSAKITVGNQFKTFVIKFRKIDFYLTNEQNVERKKIVEFDDKVAKKIYDLYDDFRKGIKLKTVEDRAINFAMRVIAYSSSSKYIFGIFSLLLRYYFGTDYKTIEKYENLFPLFCTLIK